MTHRFVIFTAPGGADVMVNAAHIVAVDEYEDDEVRGGRTCRLWLTVPCWTDDEGRNGQRYVDVVGTMLETHTVLNWSSRRGR